MSQDFLPDCPPYLNAAEYQYVIQRSNHDCALLDECRRAGRIGQSSRCSHLLNFDHIQPRELGGDDGFTNTRLLCESVNKGRPLEASEYWAKANFWDTPIRETGLREIQRMAGYDVITTEPAIRTALQDHRYQLLQTITLLPGATGIGKAVLAQGAFFAVNKVVGMGRPRIRHVLWLTVDTTLRDSTESEIRNDLVEHEISDDRPQVRRLEGYEDFLKGSLGLDVCVACPHSLWKVKDGEDVRRSDDEIRDALRNFDTIVFDEVDWASEQVQKISELARHALKFSLTASPPIFDPKFVQRCVLLSNDAIGDYRRAVQLDGCLKIIRQTEVLRPVANHEGFDYLSAGVLGAAEKTKANPDFPVYLASILETVRRLDNLETAMQIAIPDKYYSPHLIVRLPRIDDIDAAYKTLPGCLEDLALENPGWKVTTIFQNHMRRLKLSRDETTLSARDGNRKWIHPFMRSKNNLGRADKTCKRILLMCNIGLRGINNWPILDVLDLTGNTSLAEIIQFLGRGIRLPDHLRSLHGVKDLEQYITLRYCIADTSNIEEKQGQIEEARDFVLNMQQQITDRQFLTWVEIAEGKAPADAPASRVTAGSSLLTPADRLRLMNQLGLAVSQGQLVDGNLVDGIICCPIGGNGNQPPSPAKVEREREYVQQLIQNPTFLRQQLFGDDQQVHVENVMVKLKPQAEYTKEQLLAFIKENPNFKANLVVCQERIESGDRIVIDLISHTLRQEQKRLFREPGRTYDLQGQGGVLRKLGAAFGWMLVEQGVIEAIAHQNGEVYKAINIAACELFGIKDASNNGSMDQHAYHVAIQGRLSRAIENRARHHLMRKGCMPGLSALANYHEQSSTESE